MEQSALFEDVRPAASKTARDSQGRFLAAPKPQGPPPPSAEVATVWKTEGVLGFLGPLEYPNLSTIIRNRSQGQGIRFYDTMEGTDSDLASFFRDLVDDVLHYPYSITPGADTPDAKEQARFFEFALEQIPNRQNVVRHFLTAYARGFSVTEKMYRVVDRGEWKGSVVYDALLDKPQRWFTFDVDRHLRLRTYRNYIPGEPLDESKFIRLSFGSTSNPWGEALYDLCYWPWFLKHHALKNQAIFMEKWASPTAKAEYDWSSNVKLNEENRTKALQVLQAIQSDSSIAVPKGMIVSLIESMRNGTVSFEGYINQLTEMESRLVTGQLLTSMGAAGGSHALGKVHEKQAANKVEMLADFVSHAISRYIGRDLIDRNFGPQDVYPTLRILALDPVARQAEATLEQQLLANGHSISRSWSDRAFGVVLPQSKEDVLTPPTPPSASQTLPVASGLAGFDPNEPRDPDGKWTVGQGVGESGDIFEHYDDNGLSPGEADPWAKYKVPGEGKYPTTGKSKGHVAFIGKFEFYHDAAGDLVRAKIADPIMTDGRRFGRFESTPAQEKFVLDNERKLNRTHGRSLSVSFAALPEHKTLHRAMKPVAQALEAHHKAIGKAAVKDARPAITAATKVLADTLRGRPRAKGTPKAAVYNGLKATDPAPLAAVFHGMLEQPMGGFLAGPADGEDPPNISTSAKIALALMMVAIADRIAKAIEDAPEGMTGDEAADSMTDPEGVAVDQALGNLFAGTHSTNIASIATADLRQKLASPAFRKRFPYVMVVATNPNARLSHQMMDGYILSAEEARFSPNLPPFDFGCDCKAVPISADQAKAMGLTGASPAGSLEDFMAGKGAMPGRMGPGTFETHDGQTFSPGVATGFVPPMQGTDLYVQLGALRAKANALQAEDPEAWAALVRWLGWLFGYNILTSDPRPEDDTETEPESPTEDAGEPVEA